MRSTLYKTTIIIALAYIVINFFMALAQTSIIIQIREYTLELIFFLLVFDLLYNLCISIILKTNNYLLPFYLSIIYLISSFIEYFYFYLSLIEITNYHENLYFYLDYIKILFGLLLAVMIINNSLKKQKLNTYGKILTFILITKIIAYYTNFNNGEYIIFFDLLCPLYIIYFSYQELKHHSKQLL